jgi:hypothetical protein
MSETAPKWRGPHVDPAQIADETLRMIGNALELVADIQTEVEYLAAQLPGYDGVEADDVLDHLQAAARRLRAAAALHRAQVATGDGNEAATAS